MPYQLFMLALSVYAIVVLVFQTLVPLGAETRQVLAYADTGVCGIFFLDFLVSFFRAESKWRYFRSWGWIDLLSSVPTVPFLRWGRLFRIARIFRVLRGVRATKILVGFVLNRRTESTLLTAALVAMLLLVTSSVAILQFEHDPESTILTAGEAFWWSISMMTGMGMEDLYPVTSEGRAVGYVLVVMRLGLLGTLMGFAATWFGAPGEKQQNEELVEIRDELRQLRELLEKDGPGRTS